MEPKAMKKVCVFVMHALLPHPNVNCCRSIDDAVVSEVEGKRFTLQLLVLNTYLYKQSNKEEY